MQCQNFEGRYRVGLPEVALNCASAAGIDWEGGGSGECAGVDGGGKGAEGVLLLQKNVEATEKLGVRCVVSPSVVAHIHTGITEKAAQS